MFENSKMLKFGMLALYILAGFFTAEAPAVEEKKDVWHALRAIESKWQGEGSGFGKATDVTHEWDFVMQGNFLRLRTISVLRMTVVGGSGYEMILDLASEGKEFVSCQKMRMKKVK